MGNLYPSLKRMGRFEPGAVSVGIAKERERNYGIFPWHSKRLHGRLATSWKLAFASGHPILLACVVEAKVVETALSLLLRRMAISVELFAERPIRFILSLPEIIKGKPNPVSHLLRPLDPAGAIPNRANPGADIPCCPFPSTVLALPSAIVVHVFVLRFP
jgi:hypothetical protein